MDLFKELLPSILQTKRSILTSENEKQYEPYIVNRALSQHNDLILYANEMNQYSNLENKLQYDFYFGVIRPKKRPYQKWYKHSESKDIAAVKEYFNYSSENAKEALRILSVDQLDKIKSIIDKGGIVK